MSRKLQFLESLYSDLLSENKYTVIMNVKKFSNPILLCDYSDPDVCRFYDEKEGRDVFYFTASSFNFVPGLPVLKSFDLLNWTLVSYGIEKVDFPWYDIPQHGKGVWAPAIRVHDGVFYIFWAMPDEGIFEIHTKTPDVNGSWSKMNCVWEGKGFIDPCPFWDDDGKFYIVHGYAKSRIGFNSKLGILEAPSATEKVTTEDKIIFDGTKTQPTIEGPKVYKKDGFYYVLAPAGGVTFGWQTGLRSKNIFGPYEEKLLLSQGATDINGPHQGALFDDKDGGWYFLHFQDRGIFGRVTWLQRAKWENGWPVLGNNGAPEQICDMAADPATTGSASASTSPAASLASPPSVSGLGKLVLEWNTLSESEKLNFQTSGNKTSASEKNYVSPKESEPLWDNTSVLTKKIDSEKFTFTRSFDFENISGKNTEGIIFLGDEYAALGVRKISDNKVLITYFESSTVPPETVGKDKNTEIRKETVVEEIEVSDFEKIVLEMKFFPTKFEPDEKCKNAQIFLGNAAFSMKIEKGSSTEDLNINGGKAFTTKNAHWVGGRYGIF